MASYMSLSSSNSSNEDTSLHLNRLYTSGNSSNIRTANSRRRNRNTQDFDYSQTWHSNQLDSALQYATSSRSSLLNSQRYSGSMINRSQDNLHRQLMRRNHNQQSFTQTCQPMVRSPMVVVSSSDSDTSPNTSNLSIERAIPPGYYYSTSTPQNSMQNMQDLHFSSNSNDSLENHPPSIPSIHYNSYGNSM